jgi:hypothetical protein
MLVAVMIVHPSGSLAAPDPTHAPRRAPSLRITPIEQSKEVVFAVGMLGCPLVEGVGCGHLLAPILAQIDGIEGVARSYTNWTGSELRVTIAPSADRDAVAKRVHDFLAADQKAPRRLDGDALVESLKQEWRSAEHVVELTSFEYHTFARRQVTAYADELKLKRTDRDKLLAVVDKVWDDVAKEVGDPAPDAESYAGYWHGRLNRLVPLFQTEARVVLSEAQIQEFISRYQQRGR